MGHDGKIQQIRKTLMDTGINIRSDLSWGRYKKQVETLSRILPLGARVLDLGCGCGQTTAMLAVLRRDLELVGVDIKANPKWRILERFGCKFQVGNALDLGIGNEEMDSVVSFGLMEHIDDRKFLKEIYRVLKPRGYNILFNLPSRYSLSELFAGALRIWHHEQRYTKGGIVELLGQNGFRPLKIRRDDLIPAQIGRLSIKAEHIFNRRYPLLAKLDECLNKTPLNLFAQAFTVIARKTS